MSTHLVTGAAGQDGVLLCRLLHAHGHRVVGQDLDVRDTDRFAALVERERPVAVHNLAALSSVGASWQQAEETRAVNETAVTGMLAVLGSLDRPPVLVQASSSEIFGPAGGGVVAEGAPLRPVSPYGEAKAAAHRAVQAARAAGLPATNLVLFGHTSPLQAPGFVLPTITRQAAQVAAGARRAVELHDPTVARDWGSAADFVRAFALAVDAPPDDYVIATGELHRLDEVAGWALAAAGVAEAPVRATGGRRPHDEGWPCGDASRAARVLGWRPTVPLRQVVVAMVHALVAVS